MTACGRACLHLRGSGPFFVPWGLYGFLVSPLIHGGRMGAFFLRLFFLSSLFFGTSAFSADYWQSSLTGLYYSVGGLDTLNSDCGSKSSGWLAAGPPIYSDANGIFTSRCGYWDNGRWILTESVVQLFRVADPCPSGQSVGVDGKCVGADPNRVCASLGDLGDANSKWLYKGNTTSTCRGGCEFIPSSSGYDKVTGYTLAWGKLNNIGLSCAVSEDKPAGYSDSDQTKPQDAPHVGEKGYCPGQVNGVTVWVKCGDTTETTSTKSSESVSNSASGASSGSSSSSQSGSSSTTKCDGSNCTTTKKDTILNPDGSKTEKQSTSTVPQSDYCKSNPNSIACKSSSWSGDCASGFTAEGDAVQVATARAVWEAKCEIGKRDSDAENKFNEIKSDALASLVVGERTITPPTKPIATCAITDMTVQVGDFAVPFNLSGICQYLALIQKVITAFGSLMWLMIVFRGN